MKIYLSPSNQSGNKYVVGKTNEKAQMEAVAAKVKDILDKDYNCETVMATLSLETASNERPQEAKDKGCGFYLAIHSNAAGGTPPCNATGAVGFYHPNSQQSKQLMSAMVAELNAVCPIKSNRAASVFSGMDAFDGAGYGEIRIPMGKGIQSALVEVNFHDNKDAAQWIIDSKDAIAAAIVKAIVFVFGFTKKGTAPVPPASSPSIPASGEIGEGALVTFKAGVKNYYPGGAVIPAWAIYDYNHRVTQTASGGKPVVKGGKTCVLLGRRINKKTGKEEVGINTWVDREALAVVGSATSADASNNGNAAGGPGTTAAGSTTAASPFQPYLVKVTVNDLAIRKGPGANYAVAGSIKDKGVYTIIDEADGSNSTKWGKLKSGAGWVSLDAAFVQKR